jgi:hypothetical protein
MGENESISIAASLAFVQENNGQKITGLQQTKGLPEHSGRPFALVDSGSIVTYGAGRLLK